MNQQLPSEPAHPAVLSLARPAAPFDRGRTPDPCRFRSGRENGAPTEPENGSAAEAQADNSRATKGGHLYASPTVSRLC